MFKNPIRGHCFMSSGRVDSQSESVLPLSVIVFYSIWFFGVSGLFAMVC